jgi:hypothetical protein
VWLDITMDDVVFVQVLNSFQNLFDYFAHELWRLQELWLVSEELGQIIWLFSGDLIPLVLWEVHHLDEVFKISFALFQSQIDEVAILLFVKVGQQILVVVYSLQEVNLQLSHC